MIVFHDLRNHQGKDNWNQEEIHHIRKVLKDHNIVRECHLFIFKSNKISKKKKN